MSQPADFVPVYDRLKELHLDTPLVIDGHPRVQIVAPDDGSCAEGAEMIQRTVMELTGVRIPVLSDASSAACVPITAHVIALGQRSSNRLIEELYNRYLCLLDGRYPGPGGYVVRSLHNPFGNGCNVLLAGGSDDDGVSAAATALCGAIRAAAKCDATRVTAEGDLSGEGSATDLTVGWLMEIRPGRDMALPEDLREFEIWEASAGYGSIGYFGWNSLSKRLAAYYMTGDSHHAREFLRLAFPDEAARAELEEIDGERVEDKHAPLSGPYHYNAHMMVLYWDLVEESPVFTDADRLRVTNALARQFAHAEDQAWRRQIHDNACRDAWPYDEPPAYVGTRHGQWSAISLYCLCRYFARDYPAPLWTHGVAAARWHFASLAHHAWVGGENDNLFWYCTGVAPILSYMLLTGERAFASNGVLDTLLRGLDMLVSGREPDWALNSASVGFLHKAAYLTGDGRFLEYARRTGMDRSLFRLGQSYWPGTGLTPRLPEERVGRWSLQPVPEPMWQTRSALIPLEQAFLYGSFRSAADSTGDFLLIKALNGASRNPYHTFALLELRLAGQTVLAGFLNQVRVRRDGVVEPVVAMDAALTRTGVVGGLALVAALVPHAPFCAWRRTVAQSVGRHVLVADVLSFRDPGEEMEVEIWWEGVVAWDTAAASGPAPGTLIAAGAALGQVHVCDALPTSVEGRRGRMVWRGAVTAGDELVFLSLVGADAADQLACHRVSARAALCQLPDPALVVCGQHDGLVGELVALSAERAWGTGVQRVGLEHALLTVEGAVGADPGWTTGTAAAVDLDWDLGTGELQLFAEAPVRLRLGKDVSVVVRLDGQPVELIDGAVLVAPGSHTLTGAVVEAAARRRLREVLAATATAAISAAGQDAAAERTAAEAAIQDAGPVLPSPAFADAGQGAAAGPTAAPVPPPPASESESAPHTPARQLPELPVSFRVELPGPIAALEALDDVSDGMLAAATGSRVHLLDAAGGVPRVLDADADIRVLRWWSEAGLLLAGCVDEQVIAFDPLSGERAWSFTSEMDAAVWRAAKTYWFKSAPGHAGIHGLYTGEFLQRPGAGSTQAFVGSACTLEILDARGELLERLPTFWGPGTHFALIDPRAGGRQLLVAREPTDSHALAVINRDKLDATPRGFAAPPPGHSDIGGWACMSRDHIFCADVDGDGELEVVSEINGTWNRVTVWALDGTPKHSIQLGPGDAIPARTVRDLELVDLDGDGIPEVLVALAGGTVLALDGTCRPLWSRRLDGPPTALCRGAGSARVLVAHEPGELVALDRAGRLVAWVGLRGAADIVAHSRHGAALGTREGEVVLIPGSV
jgi:VCBS repeat protein